MRALLVSHGTLADALLESARRIYEIDAPLTAMSNAGQSADSIASSIKNWLDESPGEALIMVDIGGGSCGIAARIAALNRTDVKILGGVNLPMVLTFATSHAELGADALVAKLLDRALNAVHLLESDE
jgi:mannose/fructose-specific phosphotransferase system component IIA